jgi:hypothetical protein
MKHLKGAGKKYSFQAFTLMFNIFHKIKELKYIFPIFNIFLTLLMEWLLTQGLYSDFIVDDCVNVP